MTVYIRERDLQLTKVLRDYVERRLAFALGRFGEQVRRVTVRLSPTGGVDKRCRIEVDLRPKRVQVEDTDADLFAAVNRASRRVARSVAHALERERAPGEIT